MPQTLTPAPTNRAMWRKLLRRAHRLSETRLAIIRVFEDSGEPLGPTDVADILGQPTNTIKQRMYQMSKDGELHVVSRGRYTLSHNLHNLHNQNSQKVTEVTEVMTPNNQARHLSADEGDERVQRLIDQGMRPDLAVAEVLKGKR